MSKVLDFNKLWKIDSEKLGGLSSESIPDALENQQIYHYTSIDGIHNIIDNKKLWFTHIGYMNDKKEVIAGMEQWDQFVKDKFKDTESGLLFSELKKQRISDFETFVCCFSTKKDELALWNYYTKDLHNQGYNLNFNYKELCTTMLKNNPELHGCKFMFGCVDYCIDEDSYSKKMYEMSRNIMDYFVNGLIEVIGSKGKKIVKFDDKFDFDLVHYDGHTATFSKIPSFDFIYFVKRQCFNVEAEFRIVIQVPKNKLEDLKEKGIYNFRVSNGLMVPYLELNFGIEALDGITLSPTVNSDLAEKSMSDYCEYCGISNLQNGITKSDVPVRF